MTVEASKQVGYALLGQAYALAVPKQVSYSLMIYPYIDVGKQLDYVTLDGHQVHVAKQVVYALLNSPPLDAGQVAFASTSQMTCLIGFNGRVEFTGTGTMALTAQTEPPWDCDTGSPDPGWVCN